MVDSGLKGTKIVVVEEALSQGACSQSNSFGDDVIVSCSFDKKASSTQLAFLSKEHKRNGDLSP